MNSIDLIDPKKIKVKTFTTLNSDLDKIISDFINSRPIISILNIQYSTNILYNNTISASISESAMIVYISNK